MRRFVLASWLLAGPALCPAEPAAEVGNWFGDPFFQVSNTLPGCPQPAGPFTTEAEKRVQAHHRAERGTTCWLAGQCARPNSFAYDQDIAQAFKGALAKDSATFANTSLWVTVQGRTVFIEGCVRDEAIAPALEAYARAIPDVQQAIALLYSGQSTRLPYKPMPPSSLPGAANHSGPTGPPRP